jgi:diaminopimelate epimerase
MKMAMPENVKFIKLSATGNDFILLDAARNSTAGNLPELARNICRRRISVGADGLLHVEPHAGYDFRLRYFNADGSETECANGARAAAYYACNSGLAKGQMKFLFGSHVYEAEVNRQYVRLLLGKTGSPDLSPGILEDSEFEEGGCVNTGVPHYILYAEDVEKIDLNDRGAYYRYHNRFKPEGSNINFVQIIADNRIAVRTYERGVEAETLSCGTGCVAAAIISVQKKGLHFPVEIMTGGGKLTVSAHSDAQRYFLEGEVTVAYHGELP